MARNGLKDILIGHSVVQSVTYTSVTNETQKQEYVMIFPHTDLNQQFSMLYKYLTKDQHNTLKEQGCRHNEYSSIVGHFKHALEESDICINDIVRYQSEVRIDNSSFLLNIDSAANCAAELFIHYLLEIMTTDPSLGKRNKYSIFFE